MAAFHTTCMHNFSEYVWYEALEGQICCFFPSSCCWAVAFAGCLLCFWPGSSPPGPGTSVIPGCWSSAPHHRDTRTNGSVGAAQSEAWEDAFFQFLPLPNTSWWEWHVCHLRRAELLLPWRKVWERSR